jgi:hypothetical protein
VTTATSPPGESTSPTTSAWPRRPTADPSPDPPHRPRLEDDTRAQLAAASLAAAFGLSSCNEHHEDETMDAGTVMRVRDLRGMTEDRWLA